ncbi:MAG: hypothetical protein EXX96DRAFT_609442 [Benjaminiella poitrasii]|nr:MAG: hypothetical protein EXX96DRAFT_609442 [Benjaminiella poitrasii]
MTDKQIKNNNQPSMQRLNPRAPVGHAHQQHASQSQSQSRSASSSYLSRRIASNSSHRHNPYPVINRDQQVNKNLPAEIRAIKPIHNNACRGFGMPDQASTTNNLQVHGEQLRAPQRQPTTEERHRHHHHETLDEAEHRDRLELDAPACQSEELDLTKASGIAKYHQKLMEEQDAILRQQKLQVTKRSKEFQLVDE